MGIKQNIVQLRVIVGDAKGQNPLLLLLYQYAAVLLSFQYKRNFPPAGNGSVFNVSVQGSLEISKPFYRIVEIRNGFF